MKHTNNTISLLQTNINTACFHKMTPKLKDKGKEHTHTVY